MGILTKVRNTAIKTAEKGADVVAKASQLSPEQVRKIDDDRAKYLSEMPDMGSESIDILTKRNLEAIGIEVYNEYLPQLAKLYLPISETKNFEGNNRIAYFRIAKWAKDPEEDNIEKLMNVYQVLSEEDCNIALIYNRTVTECNIYLAVVNNGTEGDISEVDSFKERLIGALRGNFPGAELVIDSKEKGFGVNVPSCLECNGKTKKSVAIVSNLATEKTEKFVSQTMEKVIDGIVPKKEDKSDEYTIVLLATPLKDKIARKSRLYELYTALAPYADWQTNFTFTDTQSTGSSASFGVNIGMSAGSQDGTARAEGTQESTTNSVQKTDQRGGHVDVGTSANAGVNMGAAHAGGQKSVQTGVNYSHSKTLGIAKTIGRVTTDTINNATSFGVHAGMNFARSSNVTTTIGKNEGITQSFTNYGIKHVLENIEKQVVRMEQSSALGLWDFAAYVVSGSSVVANNVAHTYLALTQGEDSYMTDSAVNLWRADIPENIDGYDVEAEKAMNICKSLNRLQHPEFCLNQSAIPEEYITYPTAVTAAVSLSGKELARALNFPRKSVMGLPVLECASFGRDVQRFSPNKDSDCFEIGSVYHMHRKEDKKVVLNSNSITSHVFVTGSTGTGKTTTTLQLLSKLVNDDHKEDRHFLVVEPVKGEYKKKIGGKCTVYGTNLAVTDKLLKLNPFWFPKNVHVLEHIDRLIEILNACWPMYAAMPAVLKDSIERAYSNIGWNLQTGEYIDVFPTFYDVLEVLPDVMEDSTYSKDTKSDYSGALITRLRSLTNGLNRSIFCDSKGVSEEALFEDNVILDISRIGGVETKSLIMGIVMMKLQEYWINKDSFSDKLRHITVLEEAHNILRRTSTSQSQEGANLQGKSVEMLTNAIAEMRAYGEGFIIADQAPALLDEAVIRNTNTKIVLRLPDEEDRKIVGTSCSLNDNQINEIGKLPNYTAVIYQNDWIEAVLCYIDDFRDENPYKKEHSQVSHIETHDEKYLRFLFEEDQKVELTEEEKKLALSWVDTLAIGDTTKKMLRKAFVEEDYDKQILAYNMFKGKLISKALEENFDEENALSIAFRKVKNMYIINDKKLVEQICYLIVLQICELQREGEISKRFKDIAERRSIEFNW